MKPGLLRWTFLIGAAALIAGCTLNSSSTSPPPENAVPVTGRDTQMSANGIDQRWDGKNVSQRSGMTGTAANTDENRHTGWVKAIGGSGMVGTSAVGKPRGPPVTEGSGIETLIPAASGRPERRTIKPKEIFRPSDHYYVNGADTGPSLDPLPGSGGAVGHEMGAPRF